jgi:outer membrane protein assembly factor BamB
VNGWHHIGAYNFANGQEIWKLDGGGDIPVPTPVVAHGLAYFTSAHGPFRPMRAIRLEARGDITPPEVGATNAAIAWTHARQGNYMQTPIVVGNHAYGCADQGVLTCFDATTGIISYSERLGSGSEGFTASPVSDGRHLFFASEVGNVYVVPTDGKFSVTATNKLGETCMASPAISDGTLFFRTRDQLIAMGSK